MHRRALLALPFLPLPALAQPRPGAPPVPAGDPVREAGRRALAHLGALRYREAEQAAQAADPLVLRYCTWQRLQQRGGGTAAEIADFALLNPEWPAQDLLARRIEEALVADPDDSLALRWFESRPPRGLIGWQRLGDALSRQGKEAEATAALRRGWAEAPLDPVAEPGYLERNLPLLEPAQHAARFDRLVLPRDASMAVRLIPYLPTERQAAAQARLTFATDHPEAESLVPPEAHRDPGLALLRARWLRRRDRDAEAAAAFQAGEAGGRLPPEAARTAWTERNILARKLLRLGDAANAYTVAAGHGNEPGEAWQEGEFLAGFIALRRLNEPARAARHFAEVAKDSTSVITNARSLYWQGRAAEALGQQAQARQLYSRAAALPLAFYGQLAALALGEDGAALSARIAKVAEPVASAAQHAALERKELARLCVVLAGLGAQARIRPLLLRLEELAPDATEKALVARLAQRLGRPDHAVWVTRRAGISGAMLLVEGWPKPYALPPLPSADGLEPALVLGVTRQESNFDPEAVSSANAKGLMQLLPTTAAAVARAMSFQHHANMLHNPQHNMRLGAGYLAQMLNRFGGAVPLAVASYNAGPGRVDEWLAAFGDPRSGFVNMLDWMELIPFSETRNYVQRVVENIAVYRALDHQYAALPHPMTRWLSEA